jgi:flagellar biosynthesis/type III secretory pathway protein FliH
MIGKLEIESVKIVAMQEGREEGLEKGREEGWDEGARNFLISLMTNRLGQVPHSLVPKLNSLTANGLQDLGITLYDLKDYGEIEAWIDNVK